ncbi:MAG: hypothetical protein M1426_05705, partial [Patescibacteria group bacterium]|nr:hypothetical protein [Patescibacteria group bacterium]
MKSISTFLILFFFVGILNAQVILTSVRSGKVHYLPNEKAHFIGTLENKSNTEIKTSLNCRLVRHLDEVLPVGSRQITLRARSTIDVDFYYQLDGVEYGYEVNMWLEGDSNKTAEYFGVSQNVIKIGIMGDSPYQNYVDVFAWAPDDFGDLSPKGDTWWSGQGNYYYTKTELKSIN